MMLTLNDGRSELWQWDTGRTLAVDADCSQVHFSNKVFGRSIDVDVADGVAIIPDILLQTDKDLNVWAFAGTSENGYTKISKTFKVNRRNKPADYVFTPPDQTSLEEIKEKIDYLESVQDPDAIKNAVNDYLEKNPVEAPVQSVNGKTGAVELTADDVGAISQDALQEATNEALAQAKASGEFDGADGAPGKDGADGEPGKDGAPGADGQDGITPTIGPNGNWYLGSTDTGKPSRGETGPAGADGKDGADGQDATVDETLTQSGQAADAAVVGQKFSELSEEKANKRYYVATEYDVTGDGATDDQPAIQTLVNTVSDSGGGTIYLPNGVYMLDSALAWKSNVSLIGESMDGAIIKTRQAAGIGTGFSAITGNNVSNSAFVNFTVDGSDLNVTAYTPQAKAFFMQNLTDCIFRDLALKNIVASGLGIDFLINVTIDAVYCYNCGRGLSSFDVESNRGGAGIGIGTKSSIEGADECFVIRNCIADSCGNYGIFLENQGTSASSVTNFIISNCIAKNGRNHGIVVKGGSRALVDNCIAHNNAGYGFAVLENNGFMSDIIKFSNNLAYENDAGFVIDSNGTTNDIFLFNNVFSGNEYGIKIMSDVDSLEIHGNTVKSCTSAVTLSTITLNNFVFKNNVLLGNTSGISNSAAFSGNTDYIELEMGEPTAISFNPESVEINVGKTYNLFIEFSPSGTSGTVAYESNNVGVVSIAGTVATAVSAGTATITATCGELTATLSVTVTEVEAPSGNLWDSSVELTKDMYINSSGELSSDNGMVTYDSFIDVSSVQIVQLSIPGFDRATDWRLAEYNSEQVFLTRQLNLPFDTPVSLGDNTAYVKITIRGVVTTAENIATIQSSAEFTAVN